MHKNAISQNLWDGIAPHSIRKMLTVENCAGSSFCLYRSTKSAAMLFFFTNNRICVPQFLFSKNAPNFIFVVINLNIYSGFDAWQKALSRCTILILKVITVTLCQIQRKAL